MPIKNTEFKVILYVNKIKLVGCFKCNENNMFNKLVEKTWEAEEARICNYNLRVIDETIK